MDPMEIIPAEMWGEIFHHVKGAQDWLNLYAASPSFQEAVGEERHEALFLQVLPHIHKFLDLEGTTMTGLLPLRLVSHKWREAVDSTIEKITNSDNQPLTKCFTKNYLFFHDKTMSNFLDTFQNHSLNPVIGGSVVVNYLDYRADNMVALTRRFMLKFGDGVRNLHIHCWIDREEQVGLLQQVAGLIKSSVQLVPNLEGLSIALLTVGQGQLPKDLLVVETEPLIPNLKSLSFNCIGISDTPDLLEQSLLDDVQNFVLRLVSSPDSLRKVNLWGLPSELIGGFPNLSSVGLRLRSEEEMSRLKTSKWPLLSDLRWEDELGSVGLRDVFRAVEHFKTTLVSLQIYKNFDVISEGIIIDNKIQVDLPALKSLRILHIFALDVPGNFPSLEVLEVRRWRSTSDSSIIPPAIPPPPEKVSKAEILQSNLWEVFPKLKKLLVGRRGFDRK